MLITNWRKIYWWRYVTARPDFWATERQITVNLQIPSLKCLLSTNKCCLRIEEDLLMQQIVAKKQCLYGVKTKKTKHPLFRVQKHVSTNPITSFLEGPVQENVYRCFLIYSKKKGFLQLLFSSWIKGITSV